MSSTKKTCFSFTCFLLYSYTQYLLLCYFTSVVFSLICVYTIGRAHVMWNNINLKDLIDLIFLQVNAGQPFDLVPTSTRKQSIFVFVRVEWWKSLTRTFYVSWVWPTNRLSHHDRLFPVRKEATRATCKLCITIKFTFSLVWSEFFSEGKNIAEINSFELSIFATQPTHGADCSRPIQGGGPIFDYLSGA